MLQNIRDNSQGWIAKTIIGVVVGLMALTGFDAFFSATRTDKDAAVVNGDKISQNELNQSMEMQRRQLAQQLGKGFDPALLDDKLLHDSALKGLIQRRLLLQGADHAGFVFSDRAVDQVILQTPEFQVDGNFNSQRFDQVIGQMGYTRMQFRQMLAKEMLIGQLRTGLAGSSFVTDNQVLAFARLEKQTRDFSMLTVKADPKAVQLTDDEVKAYYDQHAKEFTSPDQVVIDYLELKKSAFFNQVSVSDDDLQAAYQKEIANLVEQRRAAHILIEVNKNVSDAQAQAKIQEIQARLSKGEDFAALAKELSQDAGSASKGGDLGFAAPGENDPAFDKALYELKPGEISAPVKSSFGWHLIKLLAVQPPKIPTFASMKDKLTHDLKIQQVEQRYVEAKKKLEDLAFEASDLVQPAQELKLTVQSAAPFGREGGEGLTANREIVKSAFSPEVMDQGANSGAIELDPETTVVLHVKEHRKPAQLTLQDVSNSIREQLAKEHATAAAKAQGDALIADLRSGKASVNQAVAGQSWKTIEAVTRNQDGIDPAVLQGLFRMPRPVSGDKPTYTGLALANGDYQVMILKGVNEGQAPSDQEKASYRQVLASRAGQQDFAAYRQQLEAKADIKRY